MKGITDLQHIDAGKKVDLDKVFGIGVAGLFYICNIKFNFGLPTEK